MWPFDRPKPVNTEGGTRYKPKGYKLRKPNVAKDNSIINSLKRLERVGNETSRTTEKLRYAAKEIADKIVDTVNKSGLRNYDKKISLPDGFSVTTTWVNSRQSAWDYLRLNDVPIHTKNYSFHPAGDFNAWVEGCDRKTILEFSRHIANGYLAKLSDWIENEKNKDEKALKIFEENI